MTTKNYNSFRFKKTNRSISRKKVESLKANFLKFGYDPNYPILIDRKFNIIDGQHRFTACKELGLDVYYNYANHESDEYMRSLNIVQSGWELIDYINSYAKEGRFTYVELLKFKDTHKLSTTNALIVFCGNSKAKEIRDGKDLKLNSNASIIVDYLNSFTDLEFSKRKNFALAIVSLFSKKPTPEQLEKLMKHRLLITEQANTLQFLNVFENIINRYVKKDKIYLR